MSSLFTAIWSYSIFQRADSPELGKIVLGIDWKLKYEQRKVNGHGGYLGRDHYLDQPLDFIIKRCWLCLEDLPDSGATSDQILNKEKSSSLKKEPDSK